MKHLNIRHIIILFILICMHQLAYTQIKGSTIQVKGEMVIIRIDQKSSDYDIVMQYFGLNEDSLFNYSNIGHLKKEGWQLLELTKRTAKIGREITAEDGDIYWGSQPLVFSDSSFTSNSRPGYPGNVPYGINKFNKITTVTENQSGHSVFYLPGYTTAEHVFISGNFNDWSTGNSPMVKTDSGWIYEVHLKEGKYFYKFIVDGEWMFDHNNAQLEDDGYGSYNSTYFKTNHIFVLKGYTDRKKVIVCGSFNDWDEDELRMQKTADGWALPIYLRDGTHAYKFIADGEWLLDPANPVARPDGEGNVNSFMGIGDTTFFSLQGFTDAKVVILSGEFNDWNTAELSMQKTADGWQLPYVLLPGNYAYKFIVDGKWITDPANPITTGVDQEINSVKAVKPNQVFKLDGYANAKEVYLSGNFINWSEPGYKMVQVNGTWKIPVYLPPGKYTYKFIVDGVWITDPANPQTEQNQFGSGNSVIWISSDQVFTVD